MPATKLTNRLCEAVRPVEGRQVAYPDALSRGLELRVSGDGRKVWSLRYRTTDGRQCRFTLGTFPALDLSGARRETEKHLGKIASGADPAMERRGERHQHRTRAIKTFDDLADAYLAACAAGEWRPKGKVQRPKTQSGNRDVLRLHVRPTIGGMRLEEITRPVVKATLRRILQKGITRQTNMAQAAIRQVFAYGIAEELTPMNPATGFVPLAPITQRTRVLSENELRSLWRGLQAPSELRIEKENGKFGGIGVSRATTLALELLILTLQRKSEVAGMRLDELNLRDGIWIIPAERMKGGRTHVVPLAPKAIELIGQAISLRTQKAPLGFERDASVDYGNSPFVFPRARDPKQPLRGDSLSTAMDRITRALGLKDMIVHDLRRTGATMLTSERGGVRRFIISKVLSHSAVEGAAVTAIYDRNEYLPEKRKALESWEKLFLVILSE